MTRRRSAILAIALSIAMLLGACGDDATPSANDDDAGQGSEGGGGGITVTLTADAIEMPAEVTGGIVEVTLESDLEESEVNFSQVAAGTTEEQFREAIAKTVSGGPIPEFIQAETGVIGAKGGGGTTTLVLPEGEYIAWSEASSDEEEEGAEAEEGATTTTMAGDGESAEGEGAEDEGASPDDFLTASFTATAGEAGDLPDVDGGEITARDYTFDVDVKAGADQFIFRNQGPDQFHHVVLFNFGDLEASVVEENLPAFFESEEDAPPPPAFKDLDFDNLEAGASTVLSPGLGTTAPGSFESGKTYAAVCFISDKAGGPPHAIAHGMRTVFTVE